MNEVDRLADQLKKSFYGNAWHGPSVKESLLNINSLKALARPIKNAHSIWEIVLHIDAWQEATRKRLLGFVVNLSDEEDWPQIKNVSDFAWKTALENLEKSLNNLLLALSNFDENKLQSNTTGLDYTNYFLINGLIQHEVYHAGQISLLKKSLE